MQSCTDHLPFLKRTSNFDLLFEHARFIC